MDNITKSFQEFQKYIDASLSQILGSRGRNSSQGIMGPFAKLQEHGVARATQQFTERLFELLKNTPGDLVLLAKYGWYLDFGSDLRLAEYLASLIEDDKIEKLDQYLINRFREDTNKIFKKLKTRHPSREAIFAQVEQAQNNKQYFVSIPALLAQADGICLDYTKKKFFKKIKKQDYLPEMTTELSEISSTALSIFMAPIKEQSPIGAHEEGLKQYPVKFNRHVVMHGIDTEYGTEANSLRCLSFVKYLSDILIHFEKKESQK
ncbi:hypothetical protein [Prolixibacter denitrificans]|uniref:Uncharacterized protein n=2 Tax=Prolixibacter denitrificans TaxID=1541063 RepID=A0A2P8CCJ3_9BACT|nr:hypothetical protein [Prolixibacter denitrificans]PSK82681.1 hypothetical protein CLV93_10573 [Prolixibacter denitrificans]